MRTLKPYTENADGLWVVDGMEYPPGYRPGCLLRTSKAGDPAGFPIAEEQIEILPDDEIERLAALGAVDWSSCIRRITDQNGFGSCAGASGVKGLEACEQAQGNPDIALNHLFVYHHTSGGVDGGSSIDDTLRFIQTDGCASEAVWPQSKGFRAKPSQAAYDDAAKHKGIEAFDVVTSAGFKTCLLKHGPVAYGRQGHAILAVQCLPKGKIKYANSWGDWGDKGYGIDNISAVNWGYGAWCLRTAKLPQTRYTFGEPS